VGKILDDLTGRRFGRLLVKERAENGKNGEVKWLCYCDPEFGGCGKEKVVWGRSLRNGTTRSCTCLRREITSARQKESAGKINGKKFIDLTGKKFGKLTVIKRVEDYVAPSGGTSPRWLCVCDCEDHNEVVVNGGELRRTDDGATRSCGCNGLESPIAKNLKKYCEDTYSAIPEYREFKNPETGHYLPYDIYIPSHTMFIEVNGPQHYYAWSGTFDDRETLAYRQHKDQMKKEYAEQHGTYIEIDLRKIKTTEEAIKYVESFIN
jgi:hypothetical protein